MTTSTFEPLHKKRIRSLNLLVEEYEHRATGARHIHLDADDSNNAFLVAFLTVPQDSTGVAHILEHTTLCGSERYPVRDPFFMMMRRSLNTFMNAFTASDWTAYPFASQNRKDFDNLLQVYLDAAFFPRLNPLDFAQEGHRVEFAEPGDPGSELVYKGVVFNEMKGAMSSPVTELAHTLQSHLFPATTYHYNSGGDPEEIPRLTYEALKSFHSTHYHPSNAVFMTYGNFPVVEHQERFEALALNRFRRKALNLSIPDERRYPEPIALESTYALDADESVAQKTHIVLAWLLGKSADLRAAMEANLLSGVLLDNSASPLRRALETTRLGTAPSELCGLDDSTREMSFVCGLEGSDPEKAGALQALVMDVLEDVSTRGVAREQVESVLHQLELSQREVGGGRFPYGLQLMRRALPAVLHGGDPVAVLDIDPVLAELRKQIQDPEFIKGLLRELLLDNRHRVRLTMRPDPDLSARRTAKERERLTALKAGLDAQARLQVVEQAAALKKRQQSEDDPELLPKVSLEDVPDDLKIPVGKGAPLNGISTTWYDEGTNGLVYEQLVLQLPELEPELVERLALFCDCLTEVGCGDRNYLETQAWQAAVSGGVSARLSLRADTENVQRARGYFVLATKGLARNNDALAHLLSETFGRARFDELARLRELVAQLRAHREAQVTDQGHLLAMTAATAGMGPCGALGHQWEGLAGLKELKALDAALNDSSELHKLAKCFERIRDALHATPAQIVVVGEGAHENDIRTALTRRWRQFSQAPAAAAVFSPTPADFTVREGWATSTQVNFCAKAYPTVAQYHPDAAALTVLGPFLRNGFLHGAIREEGGAYGAGANFNPDTGSFRFFSYRDPRVQETLSDFDRALEWLQKEKHATRQLEEAVLNVISEIDRPESPAGEAISAYFGTLHGRGPEERRRFRSAVLRVELEDLRAVAGRYCKPESASIAVLSNQETLNRSSSLGLESKTL